MAATGAIDFRGPHNLRTDVNFDNDADTHATHVSIRFSSKLDGVYELTFIAAGAYFHFDGDVGSINTLAPVFAAIAHNVTVATSI